jgi:hypothetical protein
VSVAVVTLVVGGEVVFGTAVVLPAQSLQVVGHSATIVGPISAFAQIETSVIPAHSTAVSGAQSRVAVIDVAVSVFTVLVSVVVEDAVVSEVAVVISCMVEVVCVNTAVGVAHEPHVAGQTSRKNAPNSPSQSEESLQKSPEI